MEAMIKRLAILYFLVLLFSCSSRQVTKQNSSDLILEGELTKDSSEYPYHEKSKQFTYSPVFGKELIDSLIIDFLKSSSEIDTMKRSHGGGDCYGEYISYSKKKSKTSVVLDHLYCGEYGYHITHYYLRYDSILCLRKFHSSIFDFPTKTSSASYDLQESIFYFYKEHPIVMLRNKRIKNNPDSTVNDLPFSTRVLLNDSI
jgi:hypothetical protein